MDGECVDALCRGLSVRMRSKKRLFSGVMPLVRAYFLHEEPWGWYICFKLLPL